VVASRRLDQKGQYEHMAIVGDTRRLTELDGVRTAWRHLDLSGYAIVHDTDLGLSPDLRAHFSERYFTDGVLETDHAEIHKDRDRARDVVRYAWHGDTVTLTEHETVTIRNRSGYVGPRNHKRVELLADARAADWVQAVLTLLPPTTRKATGTFGVNFFRTRTAVVSGPHRDWEEFCVVYVVAKTGSGAETRLHDATDPDRIVLHHTLEPGEILLFSDERYLHDVTPLSADDDTPCRRDAIVCTFDYPETYLN
jgi:2OG-Fe dioxygenase